MTMIMPESAEILDLVELLIGEKPVFSMGNGWDLMAPPQGSYITFLQGRDHAIEGAIITDLPATLYIGGKLIMLPEDAAQEQLKNNEASESVIEAVNEVINNMRTLMNNIDANPQVAPTRTLPYQVPAPEDFVGWIHQPGLRIDYTGETELGTATMILVAP